MIPVEKFDDRNWLWSKLQGNSGLVIIYREGGLVQIGGGPPGHLKICKRFASKNMDGKRDLELSRKPSTPGALWRGGLGSRGRRFLVTWSENEGDETGPLT